MTFMVGLGAVMMALGTALMGLHAAIYNTQHWLLIIFAFVGAAFWAWFGLSLIL